jgi:hypothetical protein
MGRKLSVDAPAFGRSRKATITVLDDGGATVFTDREDLAAVAGRRKAAKRLAPRLNKEPAEVEGLLETEWARALDQQREARQQAADVPVPVGDYLVSGGCICMRKQTAAGPIIVPLANFSARIVRQSVRDFGNGERQQWFVVEGSLDGGTPLPPAVVPSGRFATLDWVLEAWGHRAVVYAGQGGRDNLRAALQLLSKAAAQEVVYQHTGWRVENGEWCYLHGGGAIGPNGPLPATLVGLPAQLQGAILPDPPAGAALVEGVRASLRILDLGPDRVTIAVGGAAYRAVLGGLDFSVHFCGPSGVFKTELAALAQQHSGPGFDSRNLPANWSSTANSNEGLEFAAKDMVLVIDDFAPAGSAADVARMHKEADRLFRNVGNRASRQRMNADCSLRPPRRPRCLPVSTGEDLPRGHSCRARVITVEVAKGDIDPARLTACQADAAEGLYAGALAGFIRWLAPRYGDVQAGLGDELARLRADLHAKDQHRRTGANLAHLLLGWRYFLDFAQDVGAISAAEYRTLWARVRAAVTQIGAEQQAGQQDAEPASQFLRLLRACITSEKAHVAAPKGCEPSSRPEAWGWRLRTVGSGENERQDWQPQGDRIGWLDGDALYLDPDTAHAAAQKMAVAKGESLSLSSGTLGRRLEEDHLLTEVEPGHRTVRRLLQGRRQRVWCLAAQGFFSTPAERGPFGPTGPQEAQAVGSGPVAGTGSGTETARFNERRSTESVPGTAFGTGSGERRSTESAQSHEENGSVDRMDRFSDRLESPADRSGAAGDGRPLYVLLPGGGSERVPSLDMAPDEASHWCRAGDAGWTPLAGRESLP